MASKPRYIRKLKKWRVEWHTTRHDGSVDRGSRTFKTKGEAVAFKDHCETRAKKIKSYDANDRVLLDDAINQWLLKCQEFTDRTQGHYKFVIERFYESLPEDVVSIGDLESRHIQGFLNYLGEAYAITSNRTKNSHLTAVKSFTKYIHTIYDIPNVSEKIKTLKESKPEVVCFTADQSKEIISHANELSLDLVVFLLNTGLRADELCSLKWRNYHPERQNIEFVGKGNKRRTVTLNDAAEQAIKNQPKTENYIFLLKNGVRLSRRALYGRVSKAIADAGFTGGPHSLRHTFATMLLKKGVALGVVSKILGHSTIKVTAEVYAHFLDEDTAGVTQCLSF
jgi:integrase/recombinase XerC